MASQFAIRLAARTIRYGGIIIYPTETVYGLGCDPYDVNAIEKLSALKQRDINSRYLLLASNITQLSDFIEEPNAEQIALIRNTKPATSWVTKAKKNTPAWLPSIDGSIGFRITNHPTATALCKYLNHPLISTSANIKGKTPITTALQCHQLFTGSIDFALVSNKKRSEKPSIIRNLVTGKQLR